MRAMDQTLTKEDFNFHLPPERIAQHPPAQRGHSRLMVLDEKNQIHHRQFSDLLDFLKPGDLMVFNDTQVIPARLYGRKASGGKIELLIERILNEHEVLAHIKASRAPKAGQQLILQDDHHNFQVEVLGRQGALFHLKSHQAWLAILDQIGHIPLPPYIQRPDQAEDRQKYQTLYAKKPGAVAAPTAGLHFSKELLTAIENKGVQKAFVTLHVGAGTFQPVKTHYIHQHQMHSEYYEVAPETLQVIKKARREGRRIIAVGSTATRVLETLAQQAQPQLQGETTIFITPGYEFKWVDAMVTNFHLPESTLLMMVSAFKGRQHILKAYQIAIENQYNFFSYGDAMLLIGQSYEI